MMIFLTGNQKKLEEVRALLAGHEVEAAKVDLPEVQSMSVEEVVRQKALDAYAAVGRPVFCEDTGLYIEDLNGFPGALVKFFEKALGNVGICRVAGGSRVVAETVVAYHDGTTVHTFRGRVKGRIPSRPRGEGFGWDPVFVKGGKSFAEMSQEEKNAVSMRGRAFRRFRRFLSGRKDS